MVRTGGKCIPSSVVGILNDHLRMENGIDESKLIKISRIVESFSGIRIPDNKPLIGANVFTQTCGVHADGDSKNNLYFNDLLPERFGRIRKYALGKTSGKANIKKNLEELGMDLDPESMLLQIES
jgi:D-citramalate synthase